MKNQPLISIIVPSYNYCHFLEETVNSVLNQSYPNLECLIIDDGSEDNTEEIGKKLEQKDPRVKYFFQMNQGLSAARNTGILKSSGDYIQFLDADDLISNDKLFNQVEFLVQNKDVDIVYSDAWYFDSNQPEKLFKNFKRNNKPWMPKVSGSGRAVLKELFNGNIMVVSAPLMKKSLFKKLNGFDTDLKSFEDWDLWLRAAENDFTFHYLAGAEVRTLIRLHGSSMTNNGAKMISALVHLYKKHRILFTSDKELHSLFDKNFKKIFINLVAYFFTKKNEIKSYYDQLPFNKTERFLLNCRRDKFNFILLKVYAKFI